MEGRPVTAMEFHFALSPEGLTEVTDPGDVRVRIETSGSAKVELHVAKRDELTSVLWRQIPIGSLIRRTLETSAPEQWPEVHSLPATGPGRPRKLSPDLANKIIAPAYLAGGRRGVLAVRKALEKSGHAGSGPDGEVTPDQARKAVAYARKIGALPKASGKGKP